MQTSTHLTATKLFSRNREQREGMFQQDGTRAHVIYIKGYNRLAGHKY